MLFSRTKRKAQGGQDSIPVHRDGFPPRARGSHLMFAAGPATARARDIAPFTQRMANKRRGFAFPSASAVLFPVALLATSITTVPARANV